MRLNGCTPTDNLYLLQTFGLRGLKGLNLGTGQLQLC